MELQRGDGHCLYGRLARRVLRVAAVDCAQLVGPDTELRRDAHENSTGRQRVGADDSGFVVECDGPADELQVLQRHNHSEAHRRRRVEYLGEAQAERDCGRRNARDRRRARRAAGEVGVAAVDRGDLVGAYRQDTGG